MAYENEYRAGMSALENYAAHNRYKKFDIRDAGAYVDGSHDDTANVQATINEAISEKGGDVVIPDTGYDCIINGALQTNVGGINYKSQLYIPQNSGGTDRVSIRIVGERPGNFFQSCGIGSAIPSLYGSALRSTLINNTADAFVIASKGDAGNYGSENFNDCHIENLQIRVTPDANSKVTIGGIGFNDAINCIIRNVSIFPFNLNLVNSDVPLNNAVGIAMPKINSEHINMIDNCNVGGFESGFVLGEHTQLRTTVANCCTNGYNFGANYHHTYSTRIAAFWCVNSLKFSGASYVKIEGLQIEWDDLGKWYDSVYTILDPSDYGHGEVHYSIVEAGVGFNNAKFSKSGGANLQCMPIAFAAASSFTVTGADDAAKLASLMTVLKAKGIITY
jgi:hypothetical protein